MGKTDATVFARDSASPGRDSDIYRSLPHLPYKHLHMHTLTAKSVEGRARRPRNSVGTTHVPHLRPRIGDAAMMALGNRHPSTAWYFLISCRQDIMPEAASEEESRPDFANHQNQMAI